MNSNSLLAVLIVFTLTLPNVSFALCTEYDISFFPTKKSDELVARVRKSDGTVDLLDDSGYLSASLAYTNLMLKNRDVDKQISEGDLKDVAFIRDRMRYLIRLLGSSKELTSADLRLMQVPVDSLADGIQKKTLTYGELRTLWVPFEKSLADKEVKIYAASRNPPETNWGPEKPIGDYALPRSAPIRIPGNACSDKINTFRLPTSGPISAPPPAKPGTQVAPAVPTQ